MTFLIFHFLQWAQLVLYRFAVTQSASNSRRCSMHGSLEIQQRPLRFIKSCFQYLPERSARKVQFLPRLQWDLWVYLAAQLVFLSSMQHQNRSSSFGRAVIMFWLSW